MTESLLQNHKTIQSLEKEVKQLHESMTLLHDLVRDQQPVVDSIEDSIHYSKEQSRSGHQDLKQAKEYQGATSSINHLIALTGMVVAGVVYLLS